MVYKLFFNKAVKKASQKKKTWYLLSKERITGKIRTGKKTFVEIGETPKPTFRMAPLCSEFLSVDKANGKRI